MSTNRHLCTDYDVQIIVLNVSKWNILSSSLQYNRSVNQ